VNVVTSFFLGGMFLIPGWSANASWSASLADVPAGKTR
jgi:hypothetical protein